MSTIKVDTYLTRGGASEIAIDKLKGASSASSISIVGEGGTTTTNLQQGLAKVWVNAAIRATYVTRDSFNCSIATDHGAGEVTYSYTNNFSNNDYAVSNVNKQTSSSVGGTGFPSGGSATDADDADAGMTTSTCRWQYRNIDASPALRDQEIACHIWMGDLA